MAALAAVALLAAACGDSSPSAQPDTAAADSPPGEGVSLSVGIQRSGSSLVKELLDSSGALDDAPYSIEWAEFDGANAAVEALNAGAVDFDIALNQAAPVLAQGNSKAPWTSESAPFKVIGASRTEKSPGIAIVAQGDSGIASVADFEGK
jgi:sulfonate transport system substrate-binding protein